MKTNVDGWNRGKTNPGVRWHETKRREADQQDRMAKSDRLKEFFHGKSVAHLESSLAARAIGMNEPRKRRVSSEMSLEDQARLWWAKKGKRMPARGKKAVEMYEQWADWAFRKFKNPRRPHGTFRSCVRQVSRQRFRVRDPKAVCGAALRRKYGKNTIAIYGIGNPCYTKNGMVHAKIAGVIYNRLIEIKAQKTAFQPGYYRHPFSPQSQVKIYGLDNGDLLVHSTAGVKLWKPA